MWIRSQTKNDLVNINFMRVINDGNFCLICCVTTDGCDYELGIYSSEEKALKVLDQIQYNMEPFEHEPTMVFQMPQDEDVEV
jgi:hypothetical protein